jgi:hypothetical protein
MNFFPFSKMASFSTDDPAMNPGVSHRYNRGIS